MSRARTAQTGASTAVGTRSVLCAAIESGSIDATVGLCFLDTLTGAVSVSSFVDSQTFVRSVHRLHVFQPIEIFLPSSRKRPVGATSRLAAVIHSNMDGTSTQVRSLDKQLFNPHSGLDYLRKLALDNDRAHLEQELTDKHYALSALAALMSHIERESSDNRRNPGHSGFRRYRIKYDPPESTVSIDTGTIKSLELVDNLLDKNGNSLLRFLNSTVTKMGSRALRNTILQPLTDPESIRLRSQAVQELLNQESLLEDIRNELQGCQDLDRLFAQLLMSSTSRDSSQKINNIILVKQSVSIAHRVYVLLETSTSPLLENIKEICKEDGITYVSAVIDQYINKDCNWVSDALNLRNQKCYAVKAGKNGLLDVSRQVYKFVVDEVMSIVENLSEEYDLDIEQNYNEQRGFYLKIKKTEGELPDVFISRKTQKHCTEATTLDIVKCNARLDDTVSEILMISDQVIEELIDEITDHLAVLFMMAEAIAILDLVQCFAYNARMRPNYVCPEISNDDLLILKKSRHPILETVLKNYVPNDINSVKDSSRFQIITGTNMSGKSVFLKQVALLCIMGQIGSFVPAEYALLPTFGSIKARIAVDSLSLNASTFTSEMKEMASILEELDENTLVIIDELGRGSSIQDGYAISQAICEHMVNTRATIFLCTHFHDLSESLAVAPGVIQSHMCTSLENDQLKMSYKLTNGITDITTYGIRFSQRLLPKSIISDASEIAQRLRDKREKQSPRCDLSESQKLKKIVNLVEILKYLSGKPDGEITGQLLIELQEAFVSDS